MCQKTKKFEKVFNNHNATTYYGIIIIIKKIMISVQDENLFRNKLVN